MLFQVAMCFLPTVRIFFHLDFFHKSRSKKRKKRPSRRMHSTYHEPPQKQNEYTEQEWSSIDSTYI